MRTIQEEGDPVSTNTTGTGHIAGAGVGPEGAPFLSPGAQRKYKRANKTIETRLDMDRYLYGDLAPPDEEDLDTNKHGYAGGKTKSSKGEFDYRKMAARNAPKTRHEHANKIIRRLLGKE